MKKKILFLSLLCFVVTGCSNLSNKSIDELLPILLKSNTKHCNVIFDGYKYYIPKGIKFVTKDDYNAVLKDSVGNKYYLYVDAIGYYNKIENTYKVNNKSHYSKKLDYNKKTGYIQIDEVDSSYYIQFVYNYAKLEALVDKKDLTSTVSNMCYILRSVKFNDKILDSLIGENTLDYKEENYSLFDSNSSNETFLGVVEKYETDDYKKDLEDEKIDLNN